MMKPGPERRSSMRVPLEVKAWVRSGKGVFVRTRALDISASGALLELDQPPSEQLAVNLKVHEHAPALALQAETVWARGRQAGIRFCGSSTADLARLLRWHHTKSLLSRLPLTS